MKRAISVILSLLLLVSVTPVAMAAGDGDAMDWAALNEALKAGGEVTLPNDVAAPDGASALSVPKSSSVTLDLNGHTVDRGLDSAKKKGCVIEVLGELTVTDTSAEQTGAITGGYTDGTGGGVWVRSDGRLTLAGGAINGNTAKNVGGGVYLSGSGASFTMTGGAIAGNAAKNGGGFAMDNAGSAAISGGTISGNTANNNGGGVWFGRGTSFTLAGGSVTGNAAANQGGGVYINDGAFDYTGGSVADNQQAAGGDIAAKSGSYLPTFPVTVTVDVDDNGNEGGAVTADKETAAEGETVTLTAAPDTVHDYQLKSLTVTAGETEIPTTAGADGTYTFTMPAAAVTVSAAFREPHCINTLVLLFNDPYTDHGCTLTADKTHAIEGETVTLTLHLEPGYVFTYCDVNTNPSITVTEVNDTTFTFVMPDCDAEPAAYIEKAEFTVSLGSAADSRVMFLLNGEPKYTAPFPAQYGDWITVLFYPEDQMISAMTYTYTENGKTFTNTLSFHENDYPVEGGFRMPNGNVTVRVEFSGVYNVNEDWPHVENGIISAEVTKAAAGSYVTVYAVADERYAFNRWNFTPDVTLDSDVTNAEGTRIAVFAMPEEDVSFYAEFEQTVYDVTADLPDGHGAIDAPARGQGGDPFSFTVTPNAGYAVKSVKAISGGTELPLTQDGGVYTFDMPYAAVTLTAEFEQGDKWSDLVSLLHAGGEITLTMDYTADGEDDCLEIPEGVSVTLDLNGHTVDGSALPGSAADALIIDGALELGDSAGGGKLIRQGADDAVYVRWGSFVMTGGTIEAAVSECGCVYVNEDCSFLLTDGTLNADDCYACVYHNGSFDMRGGVLTGNVWGAMAYNRSSIMFMSGGSIEGSAGADYCYGYGVYLIGSDLYLSGAADIDVTENQFEDDPESDVDIHDYDVGVAYGMIYIAGALDPDVPVLGVDSHYYLFAEGEAAEEGGEVYTLTQSDADRFKSADPAYGIRLTDNNTLELTPCYSVTAADDITNGTVTASPATAIPGTPVALTVTPDGDYAVDTVTVNGTEIEPVDGAYGFEMPAEDVTVSAAFVLSVSPDQAAANQVIRKIDAIGEVAYNSACAGRIHAAREAYDELTDDQKALVANYDILTKAEKDYADLEEAACTITIIMDLQNKGENVTVKAAPGASVSTILDKAFPDDLPACYGFEVAGLSLHPMADDPTEEEIDAAENEILLFNATEDTTIYLVWRSTGELNGDLDDHVAAFEQAKVNAAGTLAELSQDGDSEACGRIIAAALEAMETLAYDYAVSPDENMAAVAAIVTQAETDLAAQRAEDAAAQAAADREAADEVIGKIDAIGEVVYTEACKAKIDDASDAYEALTDAQKTLVANAQALTDAIARYAELKAQAETPTDPTDPTQPEDPTEPTEPDTPSGSNNCPWDDVDHGTSFAGRLVRFFHTVLYFFARLFGVR